MDQIVDEIFRGKKFVRRRYAGLIRPALLPVL